MFSRQRPRRLIRQWMRQTDQRLRAIVFDLKRRRQTAQRESDAEAQQCEQAEACLQEQNLAESLHGCDWPDGPLSPTGVRW